MENNKYKNNKFFKGNKNAIITFWVSTILSVILIIAGVIGSIIENNSNNSNNDDYYGNGGYNNATQMGINTSYTLEGGTNTYSASVSYGYTYYLVFDCSSSYIDYVSVKDADGYSISCNRDYSYGSGNWSTVYKFVPQEYGTVTITIDMNSSADYYDYTVMLIKEY